MHSRPPAILAMLAMLALVAAPIVGMTFWYLNALYAHLTAAGMTP